MKVLFIVPYYGRWPVWMPATLLSCDYNPEFHWLLLSERPPCERLPRNVYFREMSQRELVARSSDILGSPVAKSGYSLCDLRPAFGVVFEHELRGYDFWGHCDIDVVWGRLSSYLAGPVLEQYDIVSSRHSQIAGHCTVYKNCETINRLFEDIPAYRQGLTQPGLCRLNESGMAQAIRKRRDVRVYWAAQHVVDARELDRRPFGWKWKKGQLLDAWFVERSYMHFMTWKKTCGVIDFTYGDAPQMFTISPWAIRSKTPSKWVAVRERIPPAALLWRRAYNCVRRAVTGRGRL